MCESRLESGCVVGRQGWLVSRGLASGGLCCWWRGGSGGSFRRSISGWRRREALSGKLPRRVREEMLAVWFVKLGS